MNELTEQTSNQTFMFSRWEVFEPLRRHLSFIVVFTLSATLSALLITYIYSEKYEAQMTIVLKPQDVTRLREHDTQALGAPLPQAEYKVVGQTLDDMAKSEPLLLQVVQTLHLDVPEPRIYTGPFYYRWYKEAKDSLEDYGTDAWSILKYGRIIDKEPIAEAVTTLRKNIKIENEDSNVFILKVRDKHPERVAEVTTVLANDLIAMLQKNQQVTAKTRSAELRERLAQKMEAIQKADLEIDQLLASYHTGSALDEIDKLTGEYAELEGSWVTAESDARENEALITAYTDKLKSPPQAAPGEQRLQADDFKKMASDRLTAEITLQGLEQKSATLKTSLKQMSARLQELSRAEVEYDLLDAKRQREQRDYSLINDALQEELLQGGNSVTALLIAGAAVASTEPATPIKIYHVGLAFGLGLLLALGLAFVFGYFDIRLFMSSERRDREPRPEAAPRGSLVHPIPTAAD